MSQQLTLVSHTLCPYVQRAAIALTEKAVSFDRTYIDLESPPDWFQALSPLGRVPLLRVGEHTIFESAVILEYLEDVTTPDLHPREPLERARHRAWIEFGSAILDAIARFYSARDEVSFRQAGAELRVKFKRLERELDDGPWFGGEAFSLVDCVYGPIFRYFDVFDDIDDFGILAGLGRVMAWRDRLAVRPSVLTAVQNSYEVELRTFLLKRGSWLSGLMREELLQE